jgi:hypothetical protein
MTHFHRNRRNVSRRNGGWSVVLRLALLLVSWQGPVPWCHSHPSLQSFASSFGSSDESAVPKNLATHLVVYHGDQIAEATSTLGWHFHVAFPHPASPDSSVPNGCPKEFPASLGGIDGASAVAKFQPGVIEVTDGRLAAWQASSRTLELANRPTAIRFFDHFASDLPLPLRFGVIRC